MSIKSSGLIPRLYLTLLLLLCTLPAFSILRKEFDELEKLYNRGKLNEIADELNTLKPNNDDERACINYYTAKLMIKSSDAFLAYEAILAKFPKTKYAQYSLLELG
ncbi:MAG: hypothetical protein PHO32_03865, partial [Candidatus Cloacimonetes bacterium]|nr:hypothetical protein [Candidatus Cloacimonadota bacterium]